MPFYLILNTFISTKKLWLSILITISQGCAKDQLNNLFTMKILNKMQQSASTNKLRALNSNK